MNPPTSVHAMGPLPSLRSCASSIDVSGPSSGGTELKKLMKQPAWSCMWAPTSGRSNSGAMPPAAQRIRITDAGLHEQMRRVVGAEGQDDLPLGADGADLAQMVDLHTRSTIAVEHQA